MSQNRDQMYDDLDQRTQESYKTRKGERTFTGIFRPELTLPLWGVVEGEHRGNIIPYLVGANDPRVVLGRMEEGRFTYVFDHYVHGNVGRKDQMFLCLANTYRQECPICDERNRIRKKGPPDSERLVASYEKRLKELRERRRVIYNWECLDNDEEADKGIQIWEASHYNVEEPMLGQAKLPREEGGAMINFAHPSQGKTLFFRRVGKGMTDTRYKDHRWMDRNEPIPQELLDEAYKLDELIYIPTYEEVKEAFWDEGESHDDAGTGEDNVGVDDWEERPSSTPAPRRSRASSARTSQDDPPDPSLEDEEVQGSTEFTVDDGEGQTPPRRRSRAAAPAESEQEESESEEEKLPPRRRARGTAPPQAQKDTPPARSKPKPVATPKEPEEPTCPLPGIVFGEDGDGYEDCEGCPHWKPCVKATVAYNRQKEE